MGKEKTITISIEFFNALKILKPRKIEILYEVAKGRTNREIGHTLHLSPGTVGNYKHQICEELDLHGYRKLFVWCKKHIPNNFK